MANLLLKTIGHNSFADSVYRELDSRRSRYYHFFGKTSAWTNDAVPPIAIDSPKYERTVRNEMIAMKEIAPSDIAYVLPRINWTSGIVYDEYDDSYSTELVGISLTSSGANYSSPVVTIGVVCPTNSLVTLDTQYFYSISGTGYLYTVTTEGTTDSTNSSLGTSIGVSYTHGTAVLTCTGYQATAIATLGTGAYTNKIVSLSLTYNGYGYSYPPTVSIAGGVGAGATASTVMTIGANDKYKLSDTSFYAYNSSNGNIYVCVDNNNGSQSTVAPSGNSSSIFSTADNYKWKYMSTVPTASKFLTASYIPVYTSTKNQTTTLGSVASVSLDSTGSGYVSASQPMPNSILPIVGTKYYYSGYVYTIASTVVNAIDPVHFIIGQKYTILTVGTTDFTTFGASSNTVGVTFVSTANGTALSGTGTVNAWIPSTFTLGTSTGGHTILASGVDIVCNGPLTSIVVNGDGTGASFTPQITNGFLTGIITNNVGSDYTYINLIISGAGSGAAASASLVSSSNINIDSSQALSESNVVEGSLVNIKVVSPGYGYSNATVSITGNGTGAAATAVITGGSISSINIDSYGTGYDWSIITISGDGYGATARAVISPYGGLGKDPISHLMARSLMFYSTISNNNNQELVVTNDYRQVGIIKDPIRYADSFSLSSSFASTCWKIVATSNITGITADNTINAYSNSTTYTFRVEYVSGNTALLIPIDSGTPVVGMQFTDGINSFTALNITPPSVDKFSGDLIFIDNETPYLGSSAVIRTVINF